MRLNNTKPLLALTDLAHVARIDAKTSRKFRKRDPIFCTLPTDFSYKPVSQARHCIFLANAITKDPRRMSLVFRPGYIFKIFQAIIGFDPIFMIDVQSSWARAYKRGHDERVDSRRRMDAAFAQGHHWVSINRMTPGMNMTCPPPIGAFRLCFSADSPTIRNRVGFFVTDDRFPNLSRMFNRHDDLPKGRFVQGRCGARTSHRSAYSQPNDDSCQIAQDRRFTEPSRFIAEAMSERVLA